MNFKTWGPLALTSLLASALPAQAADVGVSIGISQPGVYGRIDIGRFPQPAVVVQQPVVITRAPRAVAEPVYLWVPPGHQKHWRQHCARYNACGVPVYFVQEQWYREHGPGKERAEGHRNDRGEHRGDRRGEDRREHGRGHGEGRGG